jgi:hypothetical protein
MRAFKVFFKVEKIIFVKVKYEMKTEVPAWLWGSVVGCVAVGVTWAYHKKKGKK